MSKSKTPVKVLRAALKRIDTRWGKNAWSRKAGKKEGGGHKYVVCFEGAITNGCQTPATQAQRDALTMCQTIMQERLTPEQIAKIKRHHTEGVTIHRENVSIPQFNDLVVEDPEEIKEIIKLAIIRFETGGDPDDLYIDEEETISLLD